MQVAQLKRKHVTRGFWQQPKNERLFFRALEASLNITKPDDWYEKRVSQQQLCKMHAKPLLDKYRGFVGLLRHFYPGSLFSSLLSLFCSSPLSSLSTLHS